MQWGDREMGLRDRGCGGQETEQERGDEIGQRGERGQMGEGCGEAGPVARSMIRFQV